MAQFRGTMRGNRGEVSRLGDKLSGLRITCDGWHKGIEVVATHFNGKDIFEVFDTGGSSGYGGKHLIATIE